MASLTLSRPSTAGMAASRSAFTGAGSLRLAAPRPSSMRATRSLTAPLVLNKVKREKVTARPVKGEKREEAVDPRAPKFNKLSSGRKCQLTGQKANNAMVVTFSHKRNKKLQQVNLQKKKVYWPEAQRLVHLKISTKTMKTLEKKGLTTMAEEAGINLWKLPYTDVSDARKKYVAANTGVVPVAKNPRRMKNPEKLAASKKAPMQARYVLGRIEWYRPAK